MRDIPGRQRKPRESLCGKITFFGTGETPVVQLSDKMNQPPPTLEYSTQPPGSLIVCEERPDGLSIFIPFPGVWQGGKQGFWTVCQSVVIYLFLLYMLWIMHTWFLGTNLPRVIFFPLFFTPIEFLNYIIVASVISFGMAWLFRPDMFIELDADKLVLRFKSRFSKRKFEWPRAQVGGLREDWFGLKLVSERDKTLQRLGVPRKSDRLWLISKVNAALARKIDPISP